MIITKTNLDGTIIIQPQIFDDVRGCFFESYKSSAFLENNLPENFLQDNEVKSNGDVCNKIGTYLKALSAKDNNIPFYVALPSSTIDWKIKDPIISKKDLKLPTLKNQKFLPDL